MVEISMPSRQAILVAEVIQDHARDLELSCGKPEHGASACAPSAGASPLARTSAEEVINRTLFAALH